MTDDRKIVPPPLREGLGEGDWIQVYTGKGKGKSTAVLGLAMRAVGQGLKVLMIQFMKSTDFITGEMVSAKRLAPEFKLVQFGDSNVWGLGVPKTEYDEHATEATEEGLQYAQEQLNAGWDLIILDEIGIALHLGLVQEQAVIDLIAVKPQELELVLTGMEMPQKLLTLADLVSEIKEIKHPYNYGIEARKGIEY